MPMTSLSTAICRLCEDDEDVDARLDTALGNYFSALEGYIFIDLHPPYRGTSSIRVSPAKHLKSSDDASVVKALGKLASALVPGAVMAEYDGEFSFAIPGSVEQRLYDCGIDPSKIFESPYAIYQGYACITTRVDGSLNDLETVGICVYGDDSGAPAFVEMTGTGSHVGPSYFYCRREWAIKRMRELVRGAGNVNDAITSAFNAIIEQLKTFDASLIVKLKSMYKYDDSYDQRGSTYAEIDVHASRRGGKIMSVILHSQKAAVVAHFNDRNDHRITTKKFPFPGKNDWNIPRPHTPAPPEFIRHIVLSICAEAFRVRDQQKLRA